MRMTSALRKYALNSLLFALVLILIFLVMDIIIEQLFPQFINPYQYDDYLVHVLIPNYGKIFVHRLEDGGKKIDVGYNSFGYRDEEYNLEKTSKRIMVYGDSTVEGHYSELDKIFSKQLEKKLYNLTGEFIEVINAGVSGYGTDQLNLRIEKEFEIYEPDLIILTAVNNDYADLIRNKIYRLDHENNLIINDYYIPFELKLHVERVNNNRINSIVSVNDHHKQYNEIDQPAQRQYLFLDGI